MCSVILSGGSWPLKKQGQDQYNLNPYPMPIFKKKGENLLKLT
jgi:hypothetical protein